MATFSTSLFTFDSNQLRSLVGRANIVGTESIHFNLMFRAILTKPRSILQMFRAVCDAAVPRVKSYLIIISVSCFPLLRQNVQVKLYFLFTTQTGIITAKCREQDYRR